MNVFTTDIRFEKYTVNDQSAVLDMMKSFNDFFGYYFNRETGEKNLHEFTHNNSLGRLYLIKVKNENIGYIVLTFGFSFEHQGRDAFIDEFYLKEGYRNRGIGKRTLEFIETESVKLNLNALHLEVELNNNYANKLYVNQGFKPTGRALLTKKINSHAVKPE